LPNSGLTVNMRVAGETSITHPIGLAKFFLPSLNDNHKLKWVRLRINGTSECRRYLVRYTGTEPEDNCNQPTIPAVSPTPANNYWPSTPYL
ncbi:MAG: hypothetical protein J6S61_01010, partial [Elusimicrobiaceae bacterium]|nr:hypothetical protein [Elusimicrobiaceae bacterium]